MASISNNETLLNTKSAAEFLGLSPRTLDGKRITGNGPKFVRLSARCIRYRLADLNKWCADNTRISTSDNGHAA